MSEPRAPHVTPAGNPEVIAETRAKQGRVGSHALAILLTSLALAIMAALFLGLI